MTTWPAVPAPEPVEGAAPLTGRLEPVLQWLARCQGTWPPHRPAAVVRVDVDGGGSLATGSARADAAADAGSDLLVVSSSGDQAPAVVVMAVLLDLEPVRAVGTSPGAAAGTTAEWARLTAAVRDGLRAGRAHRADPARLLEQVAAGSVAELAGLLAQAATRRTPALLDGSATVAAAAMVAGRLAPGASAWWLAGQAPPLPAARAAHAELQLDPLLDLRLGLPAGADLSADVLSAAVDLLGPAGG